MYNHFTSTIPDNPRNRRLLEDIKHAAEKYEEQPIKDLPFSKYMIYFEKGSRLEYEADYIEHRRRLNVYALTALWTKEKQWIQGLEDILWAICNEYTWAFPAHIKIVADVTDVEECAIAIDLFAVETGITVSEICHLLGDWISPVVRNRVEHEVRRRLIHPYKERRTKFYANNWSAVCAGGIGMCTMYWGGWEEYQQIHENVLSSIYDFLGSYQDDGCSLEGILYWGYGFGYFTYYAAMVREVSGGRIDLFRDAKVKEIALFPTKAYLEHDDVLPFADSPHNFRYHIGLIHFLVKEYPEAELLDEDYAIWFDEDYRHRFAEIVRDIFWYTPELQKNMKRGTEGEEEARYYVFRQSQWYINKQKEYTLAVKGGYNDEPHNHNDLGSFVLYSKGSYIIDDLGWPEYDGEYFGENRYDNLCASAAGHSVPIIGGQMQAAGSEHTTKLLEADEYFVKYDLTGAYEEGICDSLTRCFQANSGRILMKDHYQGKLGEIRERFITRIPPVIKGNQVMIDGWQISCQNADGVVECETRTFKPRLDICKMNMKPVETAYLIDFVVQVEEPETSLLFVFEQI